MLGYDPFSQSYEVGFETSLLRVCFGTAVFNTPSLISRPCIHNTTSRIDEEAMSGMNILTLVNVAQLEMSCMGLELHCAADVVPLLLMPPNSYHQHGNPYSREHTWSDLLHDLGRPASFRTVIAF